MAVTLTSRKTTRQQLATLLGQITTFVAVYDHETKDFGRRSPVGMVHSDGSRTTWPDFTREFHRCIVTLLWAREDADATEDYLDDLAQAVRQKFYDNQELAGYWHDLEFDEQFSQLDYPIIDGIMYRRERMRVTVFYVNG